jgi:hypothetical protein
MNNLKIEQEIPSGYKVADGYPKIENGCVVAPLEKIGKDWILQMRINLDNYLQFFYKLDSNMFFIGHITSNGKCLILTDVDWQINYEEWREHGMKFSDDVVEWKGKKYCFNIDCLKCVTDNTLIYNFYDRIPEPCCSDDNIMRWECDDTPKLY